MAMRLVKTYGKKGRSRLIAKPLENQDFQNLEISISSNSETEDAEEYLGTKEKPEIFAIEKDKTLVGGKKKPVSKANKVNLLDLSSLEIDNTDRSNNKTTELEKVLTETQETQRKVRNKLKSTKKDNFQENNDMSNELKVTKPTRKKVSKSKNTTELNKPSVHTKIIASEILSTDYEQEQEKIIPKIPPKHSHNIDKATPDIKSNFESKTDYIELISVDDNDFLTKQHINIIEDSLELSASAQNNTKLTKPSKSTNHKKQSRATKANAIYGGNSAFEKNDFSPLCNTNNQINLTGNTLYTTIDIISKSALNQEETVEFKPELKTKLKQSKALNIDSDSDFVPEKSIHPKKKGISTKSKVTTRRKPKKESKQDIDTFTNALQDLPNNTNQLLITENQKSGVDVENLVDLLGNNNIKSEIDDFLLEKPHPSVQFNKQKYGISTRKEQIQSYNQTNLNNKSKELIHPNYIESTNLNQNFFDSTILETPIDKISIRTPDSESFESKLHFLLKTEIPESVIKTKNGNVSFVPNLKEIESTPLSLPSKTSTHLTPENKLAFDLKKIKDYKSSKGINSKTFQNPKATFTEPQNFSDIEITKNEFKRMSISNTTIRNEKQSNKDFETKRDISQPITITKDYKENNSSSSLTKNSVPQECLKDIQPDGKASQIKYNMEMNKYDTAKSSYQSTNIYTLKKNPVRRLRLPQLIAQENESSYLELINNRKNFTEDDKQTFSENKERIRTETITDTTHIHYLKPQTSGENISSVESGDSGNSGNSSNYIKSSNDELGSIYDPGANSPLSTEIKTIQKTEIPTKSKTFIDTNIPKPEEVNNLKYKKTYQEDELKDDQQNENSAVESLIPKSLSTLKSRKRVLLKNLLDICEQVEPIKWNIVGLSGCGLYEPNISENSENSKDSDSNGEASYSEVFSTLFDTETCSGNFTNIGANKDMNNTEEKATNAYPTSGPVNVAVKIIPFGSRGVSSPGGDNQPSMRDLYQEIVSGYGLSWLADYERMCLLRSRNNSNVKMGINEKSLGSNFVKVYKKVIKTSDNNSKTSKKDGKTKFSLVRIPSYGIQITIIDYTLSRLDLGILNRMGDEQKFMKDKSKHRLSRLINFVPNSLDYFGSSEHASESESGGSNDSVFYVDLKDPVLFKGVGDIQYDIYREMQMLTGGNWHDFYPKSNSIWITYILEKLLYCKYKKVSKKSVGIVGNEQNSDGSGVDQTFRKTLNVGKYGDEEKLLFGYMRFVKSQIKKDYGILRDLEAKLGELSIKTNEDFESQSLDSKKIYYDELAQELDFVKNKQFFENSRSNYEQSERKVIKEILDKHVFDKEFSLSKVLALEWVVEFSKSTSCIDLLNTPLLMLPK
ncbi:hypothetical protein BB558_004424 [Smittium angustum]|uniref:non-specific serine/threonine protein kinase n=1 Tax=Smittium angustum TaxID=133377 RepID=A0A2U1J368_SMIAN|nr:hypothetical protein BB558_004424 [Smittium angustum]